MGAVHDLGDLAIDGTRRELELLPQFLPLGRRAPRVDDLAERLSELLKGLVGDVEADLVDLAAGGGDAHVAGHCHELLLVLDLVAGSLSAGDGVQGHGHVAAVVRVGGDAARDLASEVARGDGGQVGATDAHLALGILADEPAGAHRADAAARAGLADGARLHVVGTVESGLDAALVSVQQHLESRRVDALGGRCLRALVLHVVHRSAPSAVALARWAQVRGGVGLRVGGDGSGLDEALSRRRGGSVLAVVAGHDQVGGVGGRDAHAGCGPCGLVGGRGRRGVART